MRFKVFCVVFLVIGLTALLSNRPVFVQAQQTDPNSSLSRGRTLLRQGHADQAIGYLETALNQFAQSNNSRGIAAAHDALGDLYMIQGQYAVALDHYKKAYEAFAAGRNSDATNQSAANSDLETANKHFQNALDAGSGALPVIAKLGQTRRLRAAARTSLGDVALRQGRYKDAAKLFTDAATGAQKDERLDLMWPAKRGLGRSLWLQAANGTDSKAAKMREDSVAAYRE